MIDFQFTGELPKPRKDVIKALDLAGQYMLKSIQRNFDVGGRPAWPPLKGGGETPLVASGRLYNSGSYRVEDWEMIVTWGEGLGAYPLVQQYGAFIPVTEQMKKFFWAMFFESNRDFWLHMALKKVGSTIVIEPRPFVMFQDEDIEYIKKLLEFYVVEFEGTTESIESFTRGVSSDLI